MSTPHFSRESYCSRISRALLRPCRPSVIGALRLSVVVVAAGTVMATPVRLAPTQHSSAFAQSAGDCELDDNLRTFTCTGVVGDPWGTDQSVWQKVCVMPSANTGRTLLRWKPTTNEFPPLTYTACWGPTGGSCESVVIDSSGQDVSTMPHPNIRYHKGAVQLCDNFTPVQPFQQSNSNGCIEFIEYNFDIRTRKDGGESCYHHSQANQHANNGNLVAAAFVNDDCTGTAWTWVSPQKVQFMRGFIARYLVRYTP